MLNRSATAKFSTLPSRDYRLRALFLVPTLALFLLLFQSVELIHHHGEDLNPQFDCEICLKVGAQAQAITAAQLNLALQRGFVPSEPTSASFASSVRHQANPRAPPRS